MDSVIEVWKSARDLQIRRFCGKNAKSGHTACSALFCNFFTILRLMQITSEARGPTRFPARCRRTSWASCATWRRTACPSTSSAKSTRCAYELSLCFFNLLTVSPASPEICRFFTGPKAARFRRHRRRLGRAKLCLLGRGQGEVGILLQNILVWLVGLLRGSCQSFDWTADLCHSSTAGSKKSSFRFLVSLVLAWQRSTVLAWCIFATWSTS